MFYSISFLRGSLVGFAVAFILAVVLFNPDWRITLGVSVLCALYGGFAANRTARIKHDRVGEEWQWENAKIEKLHRLRERHLDPFRSELAPGEDVIKYATRESRVRLLGPAGCFLVGMLLVFAGMKVGSIEPSTWKIPEIKIFEETEDSGRGIQLPRLTTPEKGAKERRGGNKSNKAAKAKRQDKTSQKPAKKKSSARKATEPTASYPAGWVLVGLGVFLMIMGLYGYIIWKSTLHIITNIHNIKARKAPPYLPFISEKFDPEALTMVADVNPVDTKPGRWLGLGSWGSVYIELTQVRGNSQKDVTLTCIPRHLDYASMLRKASRAVGGAGAATEKFVEDKTSEMATEEFDEIK